MARSSSGTASDIAHTDEAQKLAQRLGVLNGLLAISLEDMELEHQLKRALDVLHAVPWFPLKPQGAVFLSDTDGQVLQMAAHVGLAAPLLRLCSRVPFGRCLCGQAAATGEVVFADCVDDRHDVRFDGMLPHGHYCVPILSDHRVLGVLTLYLQEGHLSDKEETDFLRAVANTLAGIIERQRAAERTAQLLRENRRLTRQLIELQEEERKSLARELHDEMGQVLGAIRADAVMLGKHAGTNIPAAQGAAQIRRAVDHLHALMRDLIRRLRPVALDDLGLSAAIESLVGEWRQRRPGLPCRLSLEGNLDGLSEETNITVYRLVQEGLTNVLRHAAASYVHVAVSSLRPQEEALYVVIEDDGRGIERAGSAGDKGRFGLIGMRERVEHLGGRLDIDGAPGQGTRLRATIPTGSKAAP